MRADWPSRTGEPAGVVGDVVADEAGDEVIAVVVAVVQAQPQRYARGGGGGAEQLRAKLLRQELVGGALVDQDLAAPARIRRRDAQAS